MNGRSLLLSGRHQQERGGLPPVPSPRRWFSSFLSIMTSSIVLIALLFTAVVSARHLQYKDHWPVSRVPFNKERDTPFNVLSIIVPSSDVKTGDYYMPHSTVRLREGHSVFPVFSVKLADAKMNHAAVKLLMANSMGELWSHHYTLRNFESVCAEDIADNGIFLFFYPIELSPICFMLYFVFACTASPNLATIEGIPLPAAEKLGDEFRGRMNTVRVKLIGIYQDVPTTLFAVDFYVTVE
ncbi:hypothetical protein PRIPAC_76890 [Pristionchus pacificus]|uniref:Uncharacterized protein n=1 Tax=Pristionchus pacificus TaxID=54126 RepID=A0A2A6BXK9_PRIPA|nr:hypothetical protein PRIPAC_76890 [Pristionchus pacificus]|eukprot:PDM70503.1 hypothetical protein PRIPAC_46749 [Pristionchus pacificus]